MDSKKPANRLIKAIFICLAFLLLTGFYYHLDKYLTGLIFIILTLCIPILFLFIVVYAFKELFDIIRNKQKRNTINALPSVLYFLTSSYLLFSPYQFSSENLESPVTIRACYEGTQNQATIKFRQDKSFELNWTGIFFSNSWYTGNYIQNGDTLILNYRNEKPVRFGHLIIIKNGELQTIKTTSDSLENIVPFYLGYCKHLN
ncbi:hypothetical protein ACFP2F_18955 [Hymenobacter artigasi]